jgi:hypothetical protein
MRSLKHYLAAALVLCATTVAADDLFQVDDVEVQPLKVQASRILEALEYLGAPISAGDRDALKQVLTETNDELARTKIQSVLDRYSLYGIHINPEMRVKVAPGPANAELVEGGWSQFLVKVHNEAGTTAELQGQSPQALSVSAQSDAAFVNPAVSARPLHTIGEHEIADRWLELRMFNAQPLSEKLTGLALEYRIIQLYSRDRGQRQATLTFHVGQGTQDLGFRSEISTLFRSRPTREITLRVKDEHGQSATGSFLIRDKAARVYPSQAKRLAPDFAFHPQIYRDDGETIHLPNGTYTIRFERGPESIAEERAVTIDDTTRELAFQVRRWIDPSLKGWWSGDHHIHAAGCAHYNNPTQGVFPPDMARHTRGEDLKVGANLTWGPCFDVQKKFFTGETHAASRYPYILRYDVEVSGFGSHQSGHLVLLRLKEQIFPGGDSYEHWPTLGLNTLKWAKAQGAIVGPAHSGFGLKTETRDLPNYNIPPFDGIGANEYIVDVTHQVPGPDGALVPAVDFISTVDTPYPWELNIWYHTLNVGFRTRISGETDFPCIYGERVGLGRSYVKLDGKLDYDRWAEGIRQGRAYVSDGRSHLIDFRANKIVMGEGDSTLKLKRPATVRISAKAAARLSETPDPAIRDLAVDKQPYWHLERARIGASRTVAVEAIVNGLPVGRKTIDADGRLEDISFDLPIDKSSWVALRILPSSHTNPIFIEVGDKPVRASRKSAEWALAGVKKARIQKERFIRVEEKDDFRRAYDHAEQTYTRLIEEMKTLPF